MHFFLITFFVIIFRCFHNLRVHCHCELTKEKTVNGSIKRCALPTGSTRSWRSLRIEPNTAAFPIWIKMNPVTYVTSCHSV